MQSNSYGVEGILREDYKMDKVMVVLTGPTAVGKTKLSIDLAKAIGGEIISADSIFCVSYFDCLFCGLFTYLKRN